METQEKVEKLSEIIEGTSQAWQHKEIRKSLANDWASMIDQLADWKIFATLTFEDDVYPDVAKRKLYRLIRRLNEDVFGKKYRRIVGHSYFSYVIGIEYQIREVVHFHMLIDQPINFRLAHKLWNSWAGFAWFDKVKSQEDATKYLSKYVVKGGEVIPFTAKKKLTPKTLPYWWTKVEQAEILEQPKLF